jgi:ABC-type bacteriocin/lantibiotic exporter with double-glycine peptidase domain/CRP-like cAMP-binding protein
MQPSAVLGWISGNSDKKAVSPPIQRVPRERRQAAATECARRRQCRLGRSRSYAVDESRSVLENHPIIQVLPQDARALVIQSFVPVLYPFGSTIVREGDEADAFYIVASGRARVIKLGENGEELSLNFLRAGEGFGEMALLRHTTRTASIRASTDVEVFRLDRSVLDALLHQHPAVRDYLELQIKHRDLSNFFRLHSSFRQLPPDALATIFTELEPVHFQARELVIREGEPPGPMYVVQDGHLRVFTSAQGRTKYIAYLRRGDFFGEVSLFHNVSRTASVQAVSECKLFKFHEHTFRKLLDGYPEFRTRIEERVAQYGYREIARVPLDFAQELLPAEAAVQEKVGPHQVDQVEEEAASAPRAEAGLFVSPEGYFVPRRRKRRGFPFVRQIDEMDCAAASLAMVCRDFGRRVSLARIRQLVHASLDGASLRSLCSAATELGLAARAVKTSSENLAQLPLPAVVHWEGNHWIVVYDVGPAHVRVADPAIGLRRLPRSEFERKWTGYAALYDYTERFETAPVSRPDLRWLRQLLRPYAGVLAQALGLALVASALQMVMPVFTQIIVDHVLVEKDASLLHVLVLAMGAVLIFMVLAMGVERYLLSFVAVRIDASSLDHLVRRLLALPLTYFQTRRTGDLQRRLEGTRKVREFLVQSGVRAITAVAELAAAVALMAVYSPLMTLVFLLTAPIYALLMLISLRWLRPVFHRLEEAFARYHSYQIDAIKGIETVKALGGERAFREMLLREFLGIAAQEFRADFTVMSYQGAVHAVGVLSVILFLWVGAYQVMAGSMTIGALVAFSSLVALANSAIGTLLPVWDQVQLASVLLNRLQDVFEQEPEQGADRSRLLPVRTLEGRVRFQELGFRFGGPESPKILDGIDFEVAAGSRVAIVGRSGSGKTTLVKCLAGLLEPTEGSIFYDGVDLKTLNYIELRRQIGFVLQENHLFSDTIVRNIAFGEDEPDMDQVLWSARVANAHEFIDRLPLGYETRVGETGLALSGGQRQRLAIARALYHRPPVLVFDEATSSLDTESERAVKENIDELLKGRTSFIIAHRLSTIRDADVILVLEKGKLVESGNHDQLMKLQGLYFYLCSQQLEL